MAKRNQQPGNPQKSKLRKSVQLETLIGRAFLIEKAAIEEGQYGQEYLQMLVTTLDTQERYLIGSKAKLVMAVMRELIDEGFEPFAATVGKQKDTLILEEYDYDISELLPENQPQETTTE